MSENSHDWCARAECPICNERYRDEQQAAARKYPVRDVLEPETIVFTAEELWHPTASDQETA